MNGGLNGTMEESEGTADQTTNQKTVTSEECDTPKNSENSNNAEKEDPLSGTDVKTDGKENGTDQENGTCKSETPSMPVENINNDVSNSHCTNSNESYPESESSSQGKSEVSEQNKNHSTDEKSQDGNIAKNSNSTANNDGETHEINSEDSSDDDCSIISEGPRDTVSIDSDSDDDESSQDSRGNNKLSDIIIVENENRPDSQNGSASPEVHEITSDNDNDDCVLTNEDKSNSNLEEVEMQDPLGGKTKPIVVSNTKSLVEMAKKKKLNQNNDKQESTVVIIDSNSRKGQSTQAKTTTPNSSASAQELYQSIVARGTTVTPVSAKSSPSTQAPAPATQPSILPSLTDDMFVVEAPSFIVPYVYEKPSVEPFREFVDKLGKELEEQKAKEEALRLEKEKEEKEKREKLRQERKERGEEVSESEDEASKLDAEEKKKKKAEKREKRRRRNEDDDVSWDGESSEESDEDETLSDDDTMIIKDKADSIEEIKDVADLIASDKTAGVKSDSYFDCSLGKFFVNIGLSLVQEHVQNDLLKQQNRKLSREKKSGRSTKETQTSIASLMKNLEFSKENNAPYAFKQKKCEFCSFKTESELVMNNHLETPHMKNNLYKCNFCEYEIKSPHDILTHMESAHKIRGKLERAPAYHQCTNCPFEDNGKGKLARHQLACAKKFKPEQNLAPPVEWEPPAKIPKIARARNPVVGSYQNAFNRQVNNNMLKNPINIANLMGPGGAGAGGYRARTRMPIGGGPRAPLGLPILRAPQRNATPAILANSYSMANNGKSKHQPSISITPLPRQPQPAASVPATHNKNTFVICEICDGYIKDLEQLRSHMQWIHKVKIHPKMIYNRPPLNCQKCQFRFFTDQGLERHLLGSHGLVTSSMQEAANKGKDAGRCPVCGRVYQWKLLNHVARDHSLTLKPAHLSYKCTVCTATFGMYKQFENHVYSAHSVVAKRVMDKSKASAPAPKPDGSLLKPLKINDEITIIPQPVKPATSTKTK
ncbi:hypothetical protein NE865_06379 [Phthorimaea operculella]|nr:hypothetical protein NE865_06379 [Phthorimaea operculella]